MNNQQTGNRRSQFILMTIFAGLPVLGVLVSLYYSANIPLWDDYHLILDFLNQIREADSLSSKLGVLFSPSSNYLFIIMRLVALADLSIFGEVNFKHLILVNNLMHLFIYYFIFYLYRQNKVATVYFLPVLLLLSVPNFEVQNWSSYSAHVSAILFILATIFFLSQNDRGSFGWALLMATLALFSAPAGFIAFLAVWPLLIHNYSRKLIVLWYVAYLVLFLIYLTLILPFGPEISGAVSERPGLWVYLINMVVFYGSVFKALYADLHVWAVLFGGVLTLFFMLVFTYGRTVIKRHPDLAAGLLLSLLLAIVITIMRSRHGLGATTPYRYRLFQLLPLIFVYLYFLVNQEQLMKRFYPAIMVFSIVFYGFRMEANWHALQLQQRQLENGMHSFKLSVSADQLSYGNPELAKRILYLSQEMGIYDYDKVKIRQLEISSPRMGRLQPMQFILRSEKDTSNYYELSGWAFPGFNPMTDLKVLLVIHNDSKTRYFETGPLLDHSVFMGRSENGFLAVVDKRDMLFDWKNHRIGLALHHPLKGIIAETFIR
jgi:hypothetical protein